MSDIIQSNDKGYLTIVIKNTDHGYDLCEMGFMKKPGEESFFVDYADGRIFVEYGDSKTIIGTYEPTPGRFGSKVFDYETKRLIGLVGNELLYFCKKAGDCDEGEIITDGDCLADYSEAGSISLHGQPLDYYGTINGSMIGGAAAFVATFYNYRFNSVYRDYFTMDRASFREKYAALF